MSSRFRAPFAIQVLLSFGALLGILSCAGDPEPSSRIAGNAEPALNDEENHQLREAHFTDAEIAAVGDSVVISKQLAVKSFVDEANDGTFTVGGAMRRESHGKHQGCLLGLIRFGGHFRKLDLDSAVGELVGPPAVHAG